MPTPQKAHSFHTSTPTPTTSATTASTTTALPVCDEVEGNDPPEMLFPCWAGSPRSFPASVLSFVCALRRFALRDIPSMAVYYMVATPYPDTERLLFNITMPSEALPAGAAVTVTFDLSVEGDTPVDASHEFFGQPANVLLSMSDIKHPYPGRQGLDCCY
ncbi:hypothetical protein AK812_SmicGene8315 [Symbiodinium microadriaticum]|uniref:Uncharacterized protein n=1 Tax=Symbiodinium microadriaticum TaxID=2951 RepID=A0A1Q9EL78_SYMMI|nr:hypothetical protein AK812_SmicGene8315 [Symbiodinium microadriaticum]